MTLGPSFSHENIDALAKREKPSHRKGYHEVEYLHQNDRFYSKVFIEMGADGRVRLIRIDQGEKKTSPLLEKSPASTRLNIGAIDLIKRWGMHYPKAAESLIKSAGVSIYFAGMLNATAERGFEFESTEPGAGASQRERLIFVDPSDVESYLKADTTGSRLAARFAHYMGHALQPNADYSGATERGPTMCDKPENFSRNLR